MNKSLVSWRRILKMQMYNTNSTFDTLPKILFAATLMSSSLAHIKSDKDFIKNTAPTIEKNNYTTTFSKKTSDVQELFLTNKQRAEIVLVEMLEKKFQNKIVKFWTPAMEICDKNCLLVEFENQDSLSCKYEDFELQLFLSMKEELANNQYYDMVALL